VESGGFTVCLDVLRGLVVGINLSMRGSVFGVYCLSCWVRFGHFAAKTPRFNISKSHLVCVRPWPVFWFIVLVAFFSIGNVPVLGSVFVGDVPINALGIGQGVSVLSRCWHLGRSESVCQGAISWRWLSLWRGQNPASCGLSIGGGSCVDWREGLVHVLFFAGTCQVRLWGLGCIVPR